MKKQFWMAIFALLSCVGSASAEKPAAQYGQFTAPTQAQRDNVDGDCERVGTNLLSCWACEEKEASAQTICDFWVQTDEGEELYREISHNLVFRSQS